MLSIDVGNKTVSIIEGNYHAGNVSVTSFSEIEYKSEVVINGVITDKPALSFIINEIIKKNRMKSNNAVITFNNSDIIAREFKLPDIKPVNLKLLVKNEMARIIGEDNDYIIDFTILGYTSDKMLSVMAYAVSKGIVAGYYSLLKDIKLNPAALDVHANSICKLLSNTTINGQNNEGNVIIADIGYSKISFHGFSGGVYRFSRTEVSPVQEFVREISSILRIDTTLDDISKLDLSQEFEHENNIVSDTCRYFIYRLSEEMQKYMQYMILNSETKSVSKIYIYGGITTNKGIESSLSNSLKIPVEIIKSIGRLNVMQNCSLNKICNAAGALIRL